MKVIGYVVIEYNQASGRPSVAGVQGWSIYDDLVDAQLERNRLTVDTRISGRGETYRVAVLSEVPA